MDMASVLFVLAVLLPLMLGAAFLLGRHMNRRQTLQDELSPVSRQHIDLFQGGQLNEAAVESAKERFRKLLERGEIDAVETSLRPGTQFVVHVRALAELGTEEAGRILERQLKRRLTDDQIEQSWYWFDLANSLRSLNRSQSLPHLLRCSEAASELPLGHFFAAETVCFLEFAGFLRRLGTPLGRSALRVLLRALQGLRCGVPPQLVAEARLGELIESLWDNRPTTPDPVATRVFLESLRFLRRAPHAELSLGIEESEQEAFSWQMSHLAALESGVTTHLREAPALLGQSLSAANSAEQREILLALADLRAESADALLPLLGTPRFAHAELAMEVLTWSRDSRVGPALIEWAARRVPMSQRAQQRRKASAPRRSSLPPDVPYKAILRALRGHPSDRAEAFLVLASRDWDPMVRAAAFSSFGWWEPLERAEVLLCLQEGRRDANSEVRQAARGALARLGERQALQWFRHGLTSEEPHRMLETVQAVAAEGLTLLWPDLDRLADSEDFEISHHAREAIERLGEDLERSWT
jgi:hypothetical protein